MIDFHMHAFPDPLAERALFTLSKKNGGVIPCTDGTLTGLERQLQQNKIDCGVVLMIATRPEQTTAINQFAIKNNAINHQFFGSVHPNTENIDYQLDMLKDADVKGVKFHCEYQAFAVNDPLMLPIYRKIAKRRLITVFHAGLDIGFDVPGRCRPEALAQVLPCFQGSPVVAAHMGGYLLWQEAQKHLAGKEIYFDTSYSYANIPVPIAARLIDTHGADRILFGSDSPWSDPANEIRFIEHLDLSAAAKEAIFDTNARNLLGIR